MTTCRERVTDANRAAVLDVLRLSAAGSSVPDLVEMTGMKPWRVCSTLRVLRTEGAVVRIADGSRDELGHRIWVAR